MEKKEIEKKLKEMEKFFSCEEETEKKFLKKLIEERGKIKKILTLIKIVEVEVRKNIKTRKKGMAILVVFFDKKKGVFLFDNEGGYAASHFTLLSKKTYKIKIKFPPFPYEGVDLYTRKWKGEWEKDKISVSYTSY